MSLQHLRDEIDASFQAFSTKWPIELNETKGALDAHGSRYRASYERMVSLNRWRSPFLEARVPDGSHAFFSEALNDIISSHALARIGAWPAALKAQRSCIENVLNALYYKDHPIELELWMNGNHRLNASDLFGYLENHPKLKGIDSNVHNLPQLRSEYTTLSRAVHGSGPTFRMTGDSEGTRLWSDDVARLGMWETRERSVLACLNMLMVTLYRDELAGAANSDLRSAISLAVSDAQRHLVLNHLSVNLPSR